MYTKNKKKLKAFSKLLFTYYLIYVCLYISIYLYVLAKKVMNHLFN